MQNYYLFFQTYLGDADTAEAVIEERLCYLTNQLLLLAEFEKSFTYEFKQRLLVMTAPSNYVPQVKQLCHRFGFSLFENKVFTSNQYEYPGFKAMQSFARRDKQGLFLYIHSKGIANRKPHSMGVFSFHLQHLLALNVESVFASSTVEKACLFPSEKGWCWQNFFWVRASYLAELTIIESDQRHYYEFVIGSEANDGWKQCYAIAQDVKGLQVASSFFKASDINASTSIQAKFNEYLTWSNQRLADGSINQSSQYNCLKDASQQVKASCQFQLSIQTPPEALVERLQKAVNHRKGVFSGDAQQGCWQFSQPVKFEGSYRFEGNSLHIRILTKPALVPCHYIKKALQAKLNRQSNPILDKLKKMFS